MWVRQLDLIHLCVYHVLCFLKNIYADLLTSTWCILFNYDINSIITNNISVYFRRTECDNIYKGKILVSFEIVINVAFAQNLRRPIQH